MELAIGALIVIGALALSLAAYGVHLSNLVWKGSLSSHHETPPFDIIASGSGEGHITLYAMSENGSAADIRHEGTFGIISAGGYGQIGRILEQGEGYAVREYMPLTAVIGASEQARLDTYAYADNPQIAHGIHYETVRYQSELGEASAWFIPGSSKTWAVFAHGRGAHPNEALRIIPTLVGAGLPVLAINYRNDDGAPASADKQHWLGLTEWRDLEAAMQFALGNGAEDFVLYGYSMGGGMCINLLYESPLANKVRGVVMDSPLLDFGGTLDIVGQTRGYPRLAVRFGKWAAALRFGIDWERMNYLRRASELNTPMLVLHGEADTLVPAPISHRLKRARRDIVRYVEFADTEHARSWNSDSARYEAAVEAFLQYVLHD